MNGSEKRRRWQAASIGSPWNGFTVDLARTICMNIAATRVIRRSVQQHQERRGDVPLCLLLFGIRVKYSSQPLVPLCVSIVLQSQFTHTCRHVSTKITRAKWPHTRIHVHCSDCAHLHQHRCVCDSLGRTAICRKLNHDFFQLVFDLRIESISKRSHNRRRISFGFSRMDARRIRTRAHALYNKSNKINSPQQSASRRRNENIVLPRWRVGTRMRLGDACAILCGCRMKSPFQWDWVASMPLCGMHWLCRFDVRTCVLAHTHQSSVVYVLGAQIAVYILRLSMLVSKNGGNDCVSCSQPKSFRTLALFINSYTSAEVKTIHLFWAHLRRQFDRNKCKHTHEKWKYPKKILFCKTTFAIYVDALTIAHNSSIKATIVWRGTRLSSCPCLCDVTPVRQIHIHMLIHAIRCQRERARACVCIARRLVYFCVYRDCDLRPRQLHSECSAINNYVNAQPSSSDDHERNHQIQNMIWSLNNQLTVLREWARLARCRHRTFRTDCGPLNGRLGQ